MPPQPQLQPQPQPLRFTLKSSINTAAIAAIQISWFGGKIAKKTREIDLDPKSPTAIFGRNLRLSVQIYNIRKEEHPPGNFPLFYSIPTKTLYIIFSSFILLECLTFHSGPDPSIT